MKRLKVSIAPGAYIAAAAGVLLLPLKWLLAAYFAAMIHEFGHLLALKACRVTVSEIEAGMFGAKISTGALTPLQEIICTAAGPLASFSLLIFCRTVPVLALIGLIHCMFNLLPIYPMDGGRILRALICQLSEKTSL